MQLLLNVRNIEIYRILKTLKYSASYLVSTFSTSNHPSPVPSSRVQGKEVLQEVPEDN